MKKVGRPRKPKSEKKEIISVNLPSHLVEKLNHNLSWANSRSQWIERAILAKLKIISNVEPSVQDSSTQSLAWALAIREDCPNFIVRAIVSQYDWVDSVMFEHLKKSV